MKRLIQTICLSMLLTAPICVQAQREKELKNVDQEQPDAPKYFKKVQQALLQLGYDPGPIDGQIGPRTSAAISAFQKKVGLQVTGKNSETLRNYLYAYTLPIIKNENRTTNSDSEDCLYKWVMDKGEINILNSPESCLPSVRSSVAEKLSDVLTPRMLIMSRAGWEPFDTSKPLMRLPF